VATIAPSVIQERIEVAIAAVDGWRLSAAAYGGIGRDINRSSHRAVAVGAVETRWTGVGRQKTRARVRTLFAIEWLFKLRGKDQRQAYREALDSEAAVINAVKTMSRVDLEAVTYEASPLRQMTGQGEWVHLEVRFTITHTIAM